MSPKLVVRVCCLMFVGLVSGCASYVTPGHGADLATLKQSDAGLQEVMARKPLATFPCAIAVVRLQAPGYRSQTAESFGSGRYSVVTTRDVETTEQIERLTKLPQVQGLAPVNRLLLPERLDSEQDLRRAAAQLHADMLLVYTLDTTFYVDDGLKAASVVTLGLSPHEKARVATTASAVLFDTRNGYVYGVAEASARHEQFTNAWDSEHAIDSARLMTEADAFGKLVDELEKTWKLVLAQYSTPTGSRMIYETR